MACGGCKERAATWRGQRAPTGVAEVLSPAALAGALWQGQAALATLEAWAQNWAAVDRREPMRRRLAQARDTFQELETLVQRGVTP